MISAVRAIAGESVKAIFISGDTSATIRDLTPDPRIRTASKPVQADELLGCIMSLLPS